MAYTHWRRELAIRESQNVTRYSHGMTKRGGFNVIRSQEYKAQWSFVTVLAYVTMAVAVAVGILGRL